MKTQIPLVNCQVVVALLCLLHCAANAQLEILRQTESQDGLSGRSCSIGVTCHNAGTNTINAKLHLNLFLASSGTAIFLGEVPWRQLQVLTGQTILESATVDFPAINAETEFIIKWVDGTNKVVGTTELLVYPNNLLCELKTLAGQAAVGVLDPEDILKPLLKSAGVDCSDLAVKGVGSYDGKLLIAGPFRAKQQMPQNLPQQVKALASKGVAIVWLQPPPDRNDPLKPSFYTVMQGKGAVVIVQGSLVERLSENPHAQLNLVQFSRLALHPEPLGLPFLTQ